MALLPSQLLPYGGGDYLLTACSATKNPSPISIYFKGFMVMAIKTSL